MQASVQGYAPGTAVINVAGFGPGEGNGGYVWIGSDSGYLTLGSSEEYGAGANAYLFPPDEKHLPKKLKHKPIIGAPPQAGSQGTGR